MKRPGKTASVGTATAITTIAVWLLLRKYPPFREPGVSAPIKGEGK